MRRLRKIKIVITVLAIMTALCITALVIHENGGPVSGTETVYGNIITSQNDGR